MKKWRLILTAITTLLFGSLIFCLCRLYTPEKEILPASSLTEEELSERELKRAREIDLLAPSSVVEVNQTDIDEMRLNFKKIDEQIKAIAVNTEGIYRIQQTLKRVDEQMKIVDKTFAAIKQDIDDLYDYVADKVD